MGAGAALERLHQAPDQTGEQRRRNGAEHSAAGAAAR